MTIDQDPIEYWTSRVSVTLIVVGAAIVTGAGTVGLFAASAVATNPPPARFTVAFVAASAVIWYGVLTLFAMEIAVWPDNGRVVFRYLAKQRQTNLADITAITTGARNSKALTVRYPGGAAHVLKLPDWSDFISRVRERNPAVEIDAF
jgi:hypothetical protein